MLFHRSVFYTNFVGILLDALLRIVARSWCALLGSSEQGKNLLMLFRSLVFMILLLSILILRRSFQMHCFVPWRVVLARMLIVFGSYV